MIGDLGFWNADWGLALTGVACQVSAKPRVELESSLIIGI
jgi:hypothetical protein